MRCAWLVAVISLVGFTHAIAKAPIRVFKTEVIGKWKYSTNANRTNSLSTSQFSLIDDNKNSVGVSLVMTCNRGSAQFYMTPIDENMKMSKGAATGKGGEEFPGWQPDNGTTEPKYLGMKYSGNADSLFDYLGRDERLSIEMTVDGRRVAGEADFEGFNKLKEQIGTSCRL